MCQGGFFGKNETEGWALYEDLADKTIQWQLNPEKVNSNDSIASKGGAYSIEDHIAHEAKLTSMMRKIESLETKFETLGTREQVVNQINPALPAGCTYYQSMSHVMEECPIFLTQQGVPEHSNAAFDRPANNPYSPTYNPGWRNHPNFA